MIFCVLVLDTVLLLHFTLSKSVTCTCNQYGWIGNLKNAARLSFAV